MSEVIPFTSLDIELDSDPVPQHDDGHHEKRLRIIPSGNPITDHTRYPFSPAHSDSGETVQENTVSYVRRQKDNIKGTNIVQSVVKHEKISNTNSRHKDHLNTNSRHRESHAAPFATDFDSAGVENFGLHTSYSPSIRPVLPPRDFSSHPIINENQEHVIGNGPIETQYNEDVPPPPGTIVLSNAVKRKVRLS